ncbi:MAG: carbohydrate ABC transporter permease [Holosporales bacterium]|nr:carbohydrate ABC transporter permease [Holosporales bacterium]
MSSFKVGSEIFNTNFLPDSFNFCNYLSVLQTSGFGKSLANSAVIAIATVAIASLLALLAAYPMARMEFRGKKRLLFLILSATMFPQVAVLFGMFELLRFFDLYNSREGLVLSYMILTLPFTVWTLTNFMRQVPKEIEEAAIMDGASKLTILFRIFFPIMRPSMVTTGLMAFITSWNEFLFALTFSLTGRARTVPVAISMLSGAGQHEIPWGNIMAASVIVTIPLILIVIFFQRKIISGLTTGAIKG